MTRRASLEILRVPGPPWQRRSGQKTVLARVFLFSGSLASYTQTLQQSTPSLHCTRQQTDCKKQHRRKSKISYSIRGHKQQQFRPMSNSPRDPRANCHLDKATDRADTAMPDLPEDDATIIAGFVVGVTRPRARGTSWMSASSRKSASLLLSARSYSFACTAEPRCPLFARDGGDAERLPCFGGAWIRVVA